MKRSKLDEAFARLDNIKTALDRHDQEAGYMAMASGQSHMKSRVDKRRTRNKDKAVGSLLYYQSRNHYDLFTLYQAVAGLSARIDDVYALNIELLKKSMKREEGIEERIARASKEVEKLDKAYRRHLPKLNLIDKTVDEAVERKKRGQSIPAYR